MELQVKLILLVGTLTLVSGDTFVSESIVSKWPTNMAILAGQEGRINFTLLPDKDFTLLSIKALFVDATSPETIYQAIPSQGNVVDKFKDWVTTIPEHKHDLQIRDMPWAGAGEYYASVTHPNLEVESRAFYMVVTEKPECSIHKPVEIEEGDTVSLDCSIRYATISPRMGWMDDRGKDIPGSTVDDKGGISTPSPALPQKRVYRSSFVARRTHDKRVFQCNIYFGSHPMFHGDHCGVLLHVKYEDVECEVGDNVTIPWVFTNEGYLDRFWYKGEDMYFHQTHSDIIKMTNRTDVSVSADRFDLTITSVSLTDEGYFKNTIIRSRGPESAKIFLTVKALPTIITTRSTTEGPGFDTTTGSGTDFKVKLIPGDHEIRRSVGSSFGFECYVDGLSEDIIPDITWYTKTNKVSNDSGRIVIHPVGVYSKKLYVFDVQWEDHGTYWCQVSAQGKTAQKAVSLSVFKDIIFEDAPPTQHPWLGTNALVLCKVSGDPTPNVWWRHHGKYIHPGGRYVYETEGLRIYNITHSDSGLYSCVAEVGAEGRIKESLITVIVR